MLPKAPVIHPYNPTEGYRVNFGYMQALISMKLPPILTRSLPAEVTGQLAANSIPGANVDYFCVVQDNPWDEKIDRLLRIHPWAFPDAPSSMEGYKEKINALAVATFSPYAKVLTLSEGCKASCHQEFDKITNTSMVVFSPNNLAISGLNNHTISHCLFSMVIDIHAKRAAVTLHVVLNDDATAELTEFFKNADVSSVGAVLDALTRLNGDFFSHQSAKIVLERFIFGDTVHHNIAVSAPASSDPAEDYAIVDALLTDYARTYKFDSADWNKGNSIGTPLTYAIHKQKPYVVQGLIKRGASVTLINQFGFNAITLAAHKGNAQIIEIVNAEYANILPNFLRQHGFASDDLERENYLGTPLTYAVSIGAIDVVRILLERGASSTHVNEFGFDPIMLARHKKNVLIIRDINNLVVSQYCQSFGFDRLDLNKVNAEGYTPLVLLATQIVTNVAGVSKSMVGCFIANGAKVEINTKYGTAISLANSHAHLELALELSTDKRITKSIHSGFLEIDGDFRRLPYLVAGAETVREVAVEYYGNGRGIRDWEDSAEIISSLQTVEKVILNCSHFAQDTQILPRVMALMAETTVENLVLTYNHLGDEHARIIASYLPKTRLRTLNLGNNRVGAVGFLALVKSAKFSMLRRLDLYFSGECGAYGNPIRDNGDAFSEAVTEIGKTGICHLSYCDEGMTPEESRILSDELKTAGRRAVASELAMMAVGQSYSRATHLRRLPADAWRNVLGFVSNDVVTLRPLIFSSYLSFTRNGGVRPDACDVAESLCPESITEAEKKHKLLEFAVRRKL